MILYMIYVIYFCTDHATATKNSLEIIKKKFSLAEVTATGKSPTKFFHPHTIIEYYIIYIIFTIQ